MKEFLYKLASDQLDGGIYVILKFILKVLSFVYGLFYYCVRFGYDKGLLPKKKIDQKVISVGNITLGGVGKTPLVQWIVRILKQKGKNPAVLIRGYMAQKGKESDEAKLLEQSLGNVPVLVGKERAKNARKFLSSHDADVFVLDDGFQHWKLERDLDIVAINANNPFGNQYLIPGGILREPPSALKRAQAFILTKCDESENLSGLKELLKSINAQALIIETRHASRGLFDLRKKRDRDLNELRGREVSAFCSIGDPQSFKKSLADLEVNVNQTFSFMDHHIYAKKDICDINTHNTNSNINTIVTTEKDAVKVDHLLANFDSAMDILGLKIEIEILKGQEDLENLLSSVIQ